MIAATDVRMRAGAEDNIDLYHARAMVLILTFIWYGVTGLCAGNLKGILLLLVLQKYNTSRS